MDTGRRKRGFTLVEILIAIVVLALGITGILALFPAAIDSGNKTVEDSYSAAISQSVLDAIAVGLRETRYVWTGDGAHYTTYFIFDHDGVIDAQPALPAQLGDVGQEMWKKDYCIILPRFCDTSVASPARTDDEPTGGNTNKDFEPVFLYPVPAGLTSAVPVTPPTGILPGADPDQRNPAGVLDGGLLEDNFGPAYFASTTTEETPALWLGRTYELGRYRDTGVTLPTPLGPGDIRLEYRGQDLVDPSITVTDPKMIALDPYPHYSFAFALRRARIDTNGGPPSAPTGIPDGMVSAGNLPGFPPNSQPAADAFSNSLYELRIMIFKGFRNDVAVQLAPKTSGPTGALRVPNTNVPIKQFVTLISI